MPIITKVSTQKRTGRYNIFLDDQYAFSVSEKTLAEFVLLKGQELSEEKVEQIKAFDADAKASDLIARYLSYEVRSIKEVADYLEKHGISERAAKNAIQEFVDLGYLNDEHYAELFIKNDLQVGSDGPRSVSKKLQNKGVDTEIIQVKLESIDFDSWNNVAYRVIKSLLNQQGKISQRELLRKIQSKLYSHGFDVDLSKAIIENLNLEEDEDAELEALKKQGIKAYKRFKKYDDYQKNSKIKQYLYSHGFSFAQADSFVNGEIISLEELKEY